MDQFKFTFRKKSIILNIDPTKPYLHHDGWLAIAGHALDQIKASPIYNDDDKKMIQTLTMYQIYKMLIKRG